MKKVFFLTALLCASVMSYATQYCAEPLTLSGGAEIKLTCVTVSAGNYQIVIEGTDLNGLGGSFYNPGAVDLRTKITTSTSTKIVCDIAAESAPVVYTPLYVMCPGEQNISWPNDIEWGVCSTGKTDPGLTLNESEKTLDAASSETFQIQAQQSGDGAITYESSNPGIASVSDAGLVTAVGRGTAVISVKTAETENYALSVKTLTVTVNGPINWEAISWLAGSDDKYKVVSEPEIADKFGGKHIEPGNLWIGFPSADFGDNSSIEHTATGAGVKFPLSQFTKEYNTFNFICDGVTYAITLYYVDGTKEATAINNAIEQGQAMKVLENGQLVIIRNGMRYNAAGQYLK